MRGVVVAMVVLWACGAGVVTPARAPDLKSLDVVRREMVQPSAPGTDYQTNLRIIAITLLTDIAAAAVNSSSIDAPDREARRYFDEAERLAAGNVKALAGLNAVYAQYFGKTLRSGLAIPYLRREVALWEPLQNDYLKFKARAGLANMLRDAGDDAGAMVEQRAALAIASKYFVVGRWPRDLNEWFQYSEMLVGFAQHVRSREELFVLVRRIDEIFAAYFPAVAPAIDLQIGAIMLYQRELAEAERRFANAERNLDRTKPYNVVALACARGSLPLARGAFREAAVELDACAAAMVRTNQRPDEDPVLLRERAEAAEGLGEDRARVLYAKAIRFTEVIRTSFSVPERIAYFRNKPASRSAYGGLVRTRAAHAAKTRGESDMTEALRASDLLRARQLGDQLRLDGAGVTVAAVRAAIGGKTLVLSYSWTERGLVILAIGAASFEVRVVPLPEDLGRTVAATVAALSNPAGDQQVLRQGLAAIAKVAIAPVRPLLDGVDRVVVLPDGPLLRIPFEALPIDDAGTEVLIDRAAVFAVPSLSFLVAPRRPAPTKGLFALGDPVYPKPAGNLEFPRLPETRTEVAAIAKLFSGEPQKVLLAEAATETAVRGAALANTAYLHFATHGILGGDVPGLVEPALVLAGGRVDQVMFTASEAGQLRLDARLAVLSACSTGSGELVSGEGVLGMSRAFLAAGSRSVVVSLWRVASTATERLMVLFYEKLRAGQDLAGALRAAKLELRRAGFVPGPGERGIVRTQTTDAGVRASADHPYFWSPFILVGTGL